MKAYPRVYGGALWHVKPLTTQEGLSPRVRGSLWPGHLKLLVLGPIPACTGEPSGRPCRRSRDRAYPRVYGGALLSRRGLGRSMGLSPRVRGSLVHQDLIKRGPGPIPACTGEPVSHLAEEEQCQAYPRVYGGADVGGDRRERDRGLSPRVRGSRPDAERLGGFTGPIPACTGEPGAEADSRGCAAAYPRVYGGAAAAPITSARMSGLSPRVRGSRDPVWNVLSLLRPIPACTGEPYERLSAASAAMAYPRVYGGA